MSAPFVLAAGGTGGHLFPAEALAAELVAHGRQVRLLTDLRVEGFAADLPGIEVTHLKIARIEKGLVRTAQGLAALSAGALQSRRLLRRLAPAAVIGFGGYPSLPTMLAAVSLGLPTLIHEQNAVLGRANRLLAPLVRGIATGFPDTEEAAVSRPRPRGPHRKSGPGGSTRPRRRSLCSARTRPADRTIDPRRQPRGSYSRRCSSRRPRDIAETVARTAACQPASPP